MSHNLEHLITEADLHAFVDGWLVPLRREGVKAHLACHPEDALRVEAYRAQNQAFQTLYGATSPIDDNPEIAALTFALERALRRRDAVRRAMRAAAAVALLVVAGGAGWILHDRATPSESPYRAFTQQATDAHLLFADQSVDVTGDTVSDTSRVVSWLSQRVAGIPLRAPDLTDLDYHLAMDRALPSRDGPAAQLIYKHGKEDRAVTLYIGKSRDARPTAFTFLRNEDIAIFYWRDGPLAYSLAGDLDRTRLLRLAKAVSAQLSAAPPLPKRFVRRPKGDAPRTAGVAPSQKGANLPATARASDTNALAQPQVIPISRKAETPAIQGPGPANQDGSRERDPASRLTPTREKAPAGKPAGLKAPKAPEKT
jgi:anti-sigma factor RsiW